MGRTAPIKPIAFYPQIFWKSRIAEVRKLGIPVPLMVSFTTGEEGLGNLRGANAMISRFGKRILGAWCFDLSLERACRQAVGSKRFYVACRTAGGHSWKDAGAPNAILYLMDWIAECHRSFEWKPGYTTFNVGKISGGSGVNSIPESAEAWIEARSLDGDFLNTFADRLDRGVFGKVRVRGSATWEVTLIGDRPGGELVADHSLVRTLEEVHAELGISTEWEACATNANAFLAAGIPAIATGLARGGKNHSRDEYLEMSSLARGWEKLAAISIAIQHE